MAIHTARTLVNREHRDPLANHQLPHVHGIAVPDAISAKHGSIAGDGQRASDDLLCTIVVHVSCHA